MTAIYQTKRAPKTKHHPSPEGLYVDVDRLASPSNDAMLGKKMRFQFNASVRARDGKSGHTNSLLVQHTGWAEQELPPPIAATLIGEQETK